ncbi:hypothetical protein BH24ACT4_BH24ACT4_22000 [soil metagenome]
MEQLRTWAHEDSSTWTHVAGQLSADHHVHAFDLRGHGGSQRTERYSLELMRDDVLGAMSQLGLTDVDPIGHSLGGMVAYLMTAAHPENVRRLILEEAPPPLPAHPPREVPAPPPGELAFDWTVVPDLMTQRNDPDPGWWDAVCAEATEEEVREFCRGSIAHFKVPRHVHLVSEFPMTVKGKVRKVEMREKSIADLGLEGVAPAPGAN